MRLIMNSQAPILMNVITPKPSSSHSELLLYSQKQNKDQNSAPYPPEREARKSSLCSKFLLSPSNVSGLPGYNLENDFFLLKPDQLGWSELQCSSQEKSDANSFNYSSGAQRRTLCRLRPRLIAELVTHQYLF